MPTQTTDPNIIKLKNVRLSFPHLWTAHAMEEGQEPKFSATFIMDNDEHSELIKQIERQIKRAALDFWKKDMKGVKICLRDGNDKPELEGYGDGKMFISASSKQRRSVVDRELSPVTEENGIVYAGCYVNASVRLWVQDNKWGKRVNAELRAVQFYRDGESFGAGKVDPEEEFERLDAIDEETTGSRKKKPTSDDF